jgi:pyruvate formate-lyase/glycerol dehydratase family glycyl radical enzyme
MAVIAKEILSDLSLSKYNYQTIPLLKKLRDDLMGARKEVCIERAVLLTEYIKAHEQEPVQLQRAGAVSYYLSKRKALLLDDSYLAGNSTSKKFGAPVYPEYFGLSIWPELETISTRKANPQYLSKDDANTLNFTVYPYWLDRSITEITRTEKNPPAMDLLEKMVYFLAGKASVISHTTPCYEKMLAVGINGIIAEAQTMLDAIAKEPDSPDKRKQLDFYRSVQIALQGICSYAANLSAAAKAMAQKTSDPVKKANFVNIAEVCANVPANPPRTFKEAANALLLCHIGVLAENVNMALNPGRLDQVLYPFFKKDYLEGKLSIEEAVTISGCLWLKIGDNTNLVPETAEKLFGGAGAVPAVTLGGVDQDGNDAVNDLTYIMLRVTEMLKLRDPNVNARYHTEKNSTEYRDRVSGVVLTTKAIPAFYNDLTSIKALMGQGVSERDARDYAITGCVELGSAGREYTASSSLIINLTAALELALYNGKRPYLSGDDMISFASGDPATFTVFDDFKRAFYAQLDWLIAQAVSLNEAFGVTYQKYLPTPLLSGFFDGPMSNEKRKDLIFGGAKYNSSGATHIGFADVCDSLNAIESALSSKSATMKDIVAAVGRNFKGSGDNQILSILKNSPKYGTEDLKAQANSQDLVAHLFAKYQSYTNYRGGKYRPAFWTMTNHAGLGIVGWALPSGRLAYQVFSSGITPASQSTKNLTAAYNSVGSLGYQNIPGGYALNIKYTPLSAGESQKNFIEKFGAMISGFFNNNGIQVQYNIQSYQDLIDAKKHPEKYTDLIVRVSGYSAFFNDLNDAMKDELIQRAQYDLFSGNVVPLPKYE